jgi:hypothetical protein
MFADPLVIAVRGSQAPVKILDVAVDATSVHHNTPDLLISAKRDTSVVFTMELEVCLYCMSRIRSFCRHLVNTQTSTGPIPKPWREHKDLFKIAEADWRHASNLKFYADSPPTLPTVHALVQTVATKETVRMLVSFIRPLPIFSKVRQVLADV